MGRFYMRQDSLEIIQQSKDLNGSAPLYIIPKSDIIESGKPSINGQLLIEVEIKPIGQEKIK